MFRFLQELHCIAQGVPWFARNVGRSQEKSRDIVGMTRILPFSNLNACNMICFPWKVVSFSNFFGLRFKRYFGLEVDASKVQASPFDSKSLGKICPGFFPQIAELMQSMSLLQHEKTTPQPPCPAVRKGCSCFGRFCAQQPSRKRHDTTWWPDDLMA